MVFVTDFQLISNTIDDWPLSLMMVDYFPRVNHRWIWRVNGRSCPTRNSLGSPSFGNTIWPFVRIRRVGDFVRGMLPGMDCHVRFLRVLTTTTAVVVFDDQEYHSRRFLDCVGFLRFL